MIREKQREFRFDPLENTVIRLAPNSFPYLDRLVPARFRLEREKMILPYLNAQIAAAESKTKSLSLRRAGDSPDGRVCEAAGAMGVLCQKKLSVAPQNWPSNRKRARLPSGTHIGAPLRARKCAAFPGTGVALDGRHEQEPIRLQKRPSLRYDVQL